MTELPSGETGRAEVNRWQSVHRIPDSALYRLTAHFFRAMFDFGILSQEGADSFARLVLGGTGTVLAFGFALTRIFAGKYGGLSAADTAEPYRRALLGDDLFIIALPMLLLALVTLIVSHSIFPDEHDVRILGSLPVRRPTVFAAKLIALLLFTGMFAVVVHASLVPLVVVTSLNRFSDGVGPRLVVWAIASAGASAFAILTITAMVGVCMLGLSRTGMHSLVGLTRSTILGLLVLSIPLLLRLPRFGDSMAAGKSWLVLVPPAWFVGAERFLLGSVDPWFSRLAAIAIATTAVSTTLVAIVYVTLFRHFERLLLRPAGTSAWRRSNGRGAVATPNEGRGRSPGRRRRFSSSPAFRAVYRFAIVIIGRSQLHQGVLLGLSACGAGLAISRVAGADLAGPLGGSAPGTVLIGAAMWTPFALMFACGIAVRAAFALPMEHRANWIFRLTEDASTRCNQLRAVNRIVTGWVVGIPVAAATPLLWLAFGLRSMIATGVVALVGLVFVHAVLLGWRRIPFTCSYLPGKRMIAHTFVPGFAAFVLFPAAGALLIHLALASTTALIVIAPALCLVGWRLNRRRRANWTETPLMFDDELPDQPLQLGL
jgi:hypothetical protein